MLGLRRHTVRLVSHDPAWTDQFQHAAAQIADAANIPGERIQHVGSTSVPDLIAKPILDIDVGILASERVEDIVARLVHIGYIDRGEGEGGIGRLLVWESAPEIRTIHLHILPYDSEWWRKDLAFRDTLRASSDLRERYGRFKAELAERHPTDRKSYRQAKGAFFQSLHAGLE
jgi:GrpB-like predicted nucleotidyltransferase (UPF0157 family)